MNAYQIIQDDIQKFIRKWLVKGVIANPKTSGNFFKNKNIIQSKYNFYKNEEEYINNFLYEYDKENYLFALFDGSCVQLCYEFETYRNKSYVSKANICFLPCVSEGSYDYEYIRLDYDALNSNYFHPAAHLHIGFQNDIRLPIDEVPLLSEFFEFILYLFYPEKYTDVIKDRNKSNTFNKESGRITKKPPISNELLEYVHLTMSNL